MKLTEAEIKKYYRITEITLDRTSEKRMISIGIYKGACISIERKSTYGKVMLLYVCGNFIMLRFQDAERIEVELL